MVHFINQLHIKWTRWQHTFLILASLALHTWALPSRTTPARDLHRSCVESTPRVDVQTAGLSARVYWHKQEFYSATDRSTCRCDFHKCDSNGRGHPGEWVTRLLSHTDGPSFGPPSRDLPDRRGSSFALNGGTCSCLFTGEAALVFFFRASSRKRQFERAWTCTNAHQGEMCAQSQ